MGYKEGAVEAGQRSARSVLSTMGVLPPEAYESYQKPPPSSQMPFVPSRQPSALERALPGVGGLLAFAAITVTIAAVAVVAWLAHKWHAQI